MKWSEIIDLVSPIKQSTLCYEGVINSTIGISASLTMRSINEMIRNE